MISMRFKVKTDIPVAPGATIFGGGYCLRFRREDGSTTGVKFRFQNYKCTIEGGYFINCEAYGLHISGHVSSDDFLKLLQDCDAVWTYFDALHNLQEGDFGVMLEVSNIVIFSEEKAFRLPNFVFPGVIVEMEQNQITALTRAMGEVLGFCASHKFLYAYGKVCMYESNGKIYLCNIKGVGYCYDINSEDIVSLGFIEIESSLVLVKQLVTKAVKNIAEHISIPVKSLSMPLGDITSGYFSPSEKELGSYNIVLK